MPTICKFGNKLIADTDPSVDSNEWARIFFSHFPSGSSTKCLEHYAQIYKSKKFQNFDYGNEENMKVYGTNSAQEFNLKNISVPVAKFTGNSDGLGDLIDNQWLSEQIAHTLVFDKVYNYGHLTFFIAKDMSYLNDMLNVLNKYHSPEASTEVQYYTKIIELCKEKTL